MLFVYSTIFVLDGKSDHRSSGGNWSKACRESGNTISRAMGSNVCSSKW